MTCRDYFPLKSAYLCVDCDSISASATTGPACAGTSMLCLSRVLNRDTETKLGGDALDGYLEGQEPEYA